MTGGEGLAIRMAAGDDVAVVLADTAAGQTIRIAGKGAPLSLAAIEPIPANHKIALVPISEGADVVRNGTVIGRATAEIAAGQCVHVHNLVSRRGGRDG